METTTCPRCRASVPHDPRFPPWCECGWNIEAPPRDEEGGFLARRMRALTERLGRARGEMLFRDALAAQAAKPRLTPARAVLVVASAVLLLGLVSPPLGTVLLLVFYRDEPMFVALAVFLGLVSIALRPRVPAVDGVEVVSRATYPGLHELVGRVAAKLDVRVPDIVGLSSELSASVGIAGARKRSLFLGVPCLAILSAEERVALVGHELAHLANGDATRYRVVFVAQHTLWKWADLLSPEKPHLRGSGELFGWYVLLVLSLIPRALLHIFARLAFDQAQRAEYYADRLGARVGGTKPFVRCLEAFFHGHAFWLAQQRVVTRATERTFLDELVHIVKSTPPREVERLRRVAALELSSLDATHPPTAFRIRLLEALPEQAPSVSWTSEENEALDRELAPARERVNRELVDEYRARLYA